jgi:hypothetical protein
VSTIRACASARFGRFTGIVRDVDRSVGVTSIANVDRGGRRRAADLKFELRGGLTG